MKRSLFLIALAAGGFSVSAASRLLPAARVTHLRRSLRKDAALAAIPGRCHASRGRSAWDGYNLEHMLA